MKKKKGMSSSMIKYLLGGIFCLGAIGIVKVYNERCKLEDIKDFLKKETERNNQVIEKHKEYVESLTNSKK